MLERPSRQPTSRYWLLVIAALFGLQCAPRSGPEPTVAVGEKNPARLNSDPVPLRSRGPLFNVSEHLEARLFVDGFPAGKLVVDIAAPCRLADAVTVPIRSSGRAGGLVGLLKRQWSEATSWVRESSGRPLVSTEQYKLRKTVRHLQVDFRVAPNHYHTSYQFGQRPVRYKLRKLPPTEPVYDVASFVAVLRRWKPAPGSRAYANVLVRRGLWRVDLTFAGPETLRVGGVPVAAVRVDGSANKLKSSLLPTKIKRGFTLWFSDDDDRLPLRAEGQTKRNDVAAELVGFKPGRSWSKGRAASCSGEEAD